MELLEQLGINPEEIKGNVIDKAAEIVAKSIESDMRKKIIEDASVKINRKIENMIEETLEGKYQVTDEWGDKVGKCTSLREQFKLACEAWWKQTVDSNGNLKNDSWGSQPRWKYVADKAMLDVLNSQLKNELNKMVEMARTSLRAGIAEKLTEAMDRMWGKSPEVEVK